MRERSLAMFFGMFTVVVTIATPVLGAPDYLWTFDGDLDGWTTSGQCGLTDTWVWSFDGGGGSLKAQQSGSGNSSMLLTSPIFGVAGAQSADISFNHRFDTEACCDHGYAVYRLNGGPWMRLEPKVGPYNVFDFMYNDPFFGGCGFSPDMDVFAGDSGGYIDSTGRIDLSNASALQLGFLYTSDASFVDDAWYLNSVSVELIDSADCYSSSGGCQFPFDSGTGDWFAYPECGLEGTWALVDDGGEMALKAQQIGSGNSAMVMLSPPIDVRDASQVNLSFNHRYNTETCCDHGYVAYRLDGAPWQQFTPSTGTYNIFDFMYNDPFFGSPNACDNSPDMNVFAGDSGGYFDSSGTAVVISGQSLEFAFLYTTDASFVDEAWFLNGVDIDVSLALRDFGDAPSPYPTSLATDGARHKFGGGPILGTARDNELDGQGSPFATGDDVGGGDDEDGVTFTSPLVRDISSTIASLDVSTIGSGVLNAWIDFDRDGAWSSREQIFFDQALPGGIANLNFPVTTEAIPGWTFARFRASEESGLGPSGAAVSGEVEDYRVHIQAVDSIEISGGTLQGTRSFYACDTLFISDTTVKSSAVISFVAGGQVAFGNNVEIRSNAQVTVGIDPSICPP